MRRALLIALALAVATWIAWGLSLRRGAAHDAGARPPPGEWRGAWHVHTTASDGRAPLDAVVRDAAEAGLQFVVVTDHNARVPAAPEVRHGVLVIPGTEISSPVGHVAALGVPRALTQAERDGNPFDAVAALGGRAVVAHPLHPRRPFGGDWDDPRIAALEPVSNDSFWGKTLAERRIAPFLRALLAAPWDGARAVLDLYGEPEAELWRYDTLAVRARAAGRRPPALLCSADAHGYPSYRAAFLAFSMHVRLTPTGDAARDAAQVTRGLLDGSATCVFDAVAPGWQVSLRAGGGPDARTLGFAAPFRAAELRVFRDGHLVRSVPQGPGGATPVCGDRALPCAPGDWRVEARVDGRPWIFTNPAVIE